MYYGVERTIGIYIVASFLLSKIVLTSSTTAPQNKELRMTIFLECARMGAPKIIQKM